MAPSKEDYFTGAKVGDEAMCADVLSKKLKMMTLSTRLGASSSSLRPTEPYAGGRLDNPKQARENEELKPEELVARMIVLGGFDPSIIDNDHFKSLMRSHWPSSSDVPSRIHVEEMCDGIFDEARSNVLVRLSKTSGRISLAVGKAKILDREVIYTACHFIDQHWKLHKVVLDAHVLVPCLPHHGPLSDVPEVYTGLGTKHIIEDLPLGTSLRGGDLCSRLFMMAWGIVPDSESEHCQQRHEMKAREHHSNAMKHQLGMVFSNTFPVEMGLVSTTFIDQVLEPIARCLQFVFLGFKKNISEELLGLHLTRQVRHQLHSEHGLKRLSTYDKNWYRTYCALRILKHNKPALIDEDPELAELLIKVFGTIYDAIEAISDPSCPTSNLCLPELLKVRKVLHLEIARSRENNPNIYNICPSELIKPENITKCLRDAEGTLDKAIKDSYLIWSVPLVLDPRYKLQRTRSLFKSEYGSKKADEMSSEVLTKLKQLYTKYSQDGGSIAMDIDSADLPEQDTTELDQYLEGSPISFKGKVIKEGSEILDWWKENEQKYPMLAQMARDALAMPTCSSISSEEMVAHMSSIVRGYSKKPLEPLCSEEGAAMAAAQDEEARAAATTAAIERAEAAADAAIEAAQDENAPASAAAKAAEIAAEAAKALAAAAPAAARAKVEAKARAANKAAEAAAKAAAKQKTKSATLEAAKAALATLKAARAAAAAAAEEEEETSYTALLFGSDDDLNPEDKGKKRKQEKTEDGNRKMKA